MGLGRIRLADEHAQPRGRDRPDRDVRRHGRDAGRGARVPEAFDEHGVVFGVAYLVVREMHLALYALAARGDHDLAGAVWRFTPSSTISGVLILTAGFLDGDVQIALWVIALSIDYLGALVGRGAGWHLSPGHFAERHGLIVIIAIGESIVALGIGATGTPLGAGAITAAILGFTVAAALWWTYFDWVSIVIEQQLHRLRAHRWQTSRATPIRICTFQWSPESSSSRSA